MLKFRKVYISNYLSIGEAELDLDNQGLVLIEGENSSNDTYISNGSGKTTCLSSVTYAIFGVSPNGQKADEIINSQVGKNLSVILEFEKDGTPYRIERYRKHSKHKNTVKFYQGEVDLTQKSVADTDKKILDVFGIDYITYMNSIMYGQGDVEIFAKASDKGKKQILENLADIGIYRLAQDIAKEKAKTAEANQQEFERQIDLKTQEKQFVEQNFFTETEKYRQTSKSIKDQEKYNRQAAENIELTRKEKESKVQDNAPAIQSLEAQISKAQSSDIDQEKVTELNNLGLAVSKLKVALNQLETNISSNQQAYQKVQSETNCYVCGAPLDPKHREEEMNRLSGEIEKDTQQKEKIAAALTAYQASYDSLDQEIKVEREAIQKANSSYRDLVVEKQRLENEITSFDTQINQLESKLESGKSILAAYQNIPKPEKDKVREKALDKEIKDLSTKLEEAKKEADQYKVLATEVFSNKGIRSDVLDLVTPFLNERANEYLAILSGSDIEVRFSTQTTTAKGELRDKFDLEVINGSGGGTYQANSAGERKRIDLAISFAIQDLVQSKANIAVNLALYDEVFDGLDAIGCENVIKILKERQKEVSSIFVITHSEDLKPLFEHVITIAKEKGVSYVKSKK